MSATNPYPPNTYHWKLWEQMHGGQGGVAINLGGQSLGNAAIISDGTAILIGGTNVTLSQSSNSITFIAGGGGTGGGSAFTAGISSGGNTSGTTGVATGQLIFVGGNNITLSQSIDPFNGSATITISAFNTVFNQSVQTQNLHDLSLSGNTSGALALISSGTAILVGGNNITLSQNGQSITISGPNTVAQTVQTQNMVSVNGSTGSIVFTAGNNITLSQSASTITISAASQSVQPEGTQTAGISNLGNTAGTSGVISGTGVQLILAGGNNVTLSQSVNGSSATITVSAFNQSVQPEGTITAGISNLGNTAGTSGVVSGTGIQLIFAGGNNITLSQSTNGSSATITISGANAGAGAGFTAGMSNLGNTSGTTGVASSRLVLVGGNNITLSQSLDVGNGSATITISAPNTVAQSTQTQNLFDLTLAGNTSGTLALVSSGTLTLVGGNSITLSQVGNAITISGASTSQSVQTQNLHNVTLSGNTSGTLAAISSGTLTLAGGNNITLSQVGNAVTISGATTAAQTVQTQNVVDVSLSGNTSGTLALVSSGTLILAGGNSITLSQQGQSVTISGATTSQSVQTQNLHNVTLAGNTSGTLAQVSSGTLTLAGGNNVTLSQVGNAITISGANTVAQSVQTQNVVDLSLSGNTSGTLALISSGTGILAGGNNITLSQVGQSITISGPTTVAQSVQTQNVVDVSLSGNTSGALALISSGTMILAGGANITLSQNGQSISVIGGAGGAGAFTAGVSTDGNTAGNTGTVASQIIFVGGNNVTLSESRNGNSATVTISGANAGAGAGFTAGMSNLGNTSGTTGVASSRLIIVGGNNITLSQSLDAGNGSGTITISAASIPAQTVQTQNVVDVSLSGNTSGALALISSGTMILAGGNNVTLSQNGQSVTISGANTVAQSVQTQNLIDVSLSGNTSGALALVSSGTLILAGGNNIVLSQNGQSVTISASNAPAQSTQTQNLFDLTLSGNTSGTLALVSSGTLSLAGGNNITLSQVGNAITISGPNTQAQSVQTQNLVDVSLSGNTSGALALVSSGTLILAGGNNITLSQNGQSVTISAFTQSIQPEGTITAGISNLGNTAGTSGTISGTGLQLLFAGGNNVTLSQSINGSSATITVSAFNQSVQPLGTVTAGISNLGNTIGTSGVATGTGIQFVLAGGNNVTLSQSLNGSSATVTISAFNQTQESNTFGMSNLGNTSGTSGVVSGNQLQLVLAGGNNITLSQSINGSSATITISAPNLGGGAGLNAGISTDGNTSGTTGFVASSLQFVGGNNITLSQSVNGQSATLTISAGAGGGAFSAGISGTDGNTSGTTGLVGSQLLLIGGNNITLSGSNDTGNNSATITISGPAQAQVPVISHWMNMKAGVGGSVASNALVSLATSNGTLWVFPLHDPSDIFPGNMTLNTLLFNMSCTGSSNTSGAHTYTVSVGIYTLQDASHLALAFSGSTSWNLAANNGNSGSYLGERWLSVHSSLFNTTPTFSNTSYWMGFWMRSSGVAYSISNLGVRWLTSDNRSGFLASASASNKTFPNYPFHGIFSASFSSAMPTAIDRSDMSYGGSGYGMAIPHVVFNNLSGIYG